MKAPLVAILAGGEGSRIGGRKAERMLGGETLLARAIAKAQPWSDDLRICVRRPDQLQRKPLPLILDEPALAGPLGGLAAALRAARSAGRETLVTLPCDIPFVPEDLPFRLARIVGSFNAALPESRGELHSACGLWRVASLDALDEYAASGRRSLSGFAEVAGFKTLCWPDDSDLFFNVNNPADLALAEARLRS